MRRSRTVLHLLLIALSVTATTVVRPEPAVAAPGDAVIVEALGPEILDWVNDERAARDLPALTWDQSLLVSTADWATHISDSNMLVHDFDLPAGQTEDLGGGLLTTRSSGIVHAWMRSNDHRNSILGDASGAAISVACNPVSGHASIVFRARLVNPHELPDPTEELPAVVPKDRGRRCIDFDLTIPGGTGGGTDPAPDGSMFLADGPIRVLDTRQEINDPFRGPANMVLDPPAGATHAVLNVTATEGTGAGFLRLWPAETAEPTTSAVNWAAGETAPNMVVVPVGPSGIINLYASSPTHVVADLTGWFTGDDGGLTPITPRRAVDTRASVAVAPHGTIDTRLGLAEGTTAASISLTAVDAIGAGYLTVWPTGETRPLASTVNFVAGDTRANAAIVGVGGEGSVSVYNGSSQPIHVLLDVNGGFSPDGAERLHQMTPDRILDTRNGVALSSSSPRPLVVGDAADGVALVNVTTVEATGVGWIAALSTAQAIGSTSTQNLSPDRTVATAALVPVDASGSWRLATSAPALDAVVDVVGVFR